MNGTPNQKEEIERKVEENMEDLVTNGGYGTAVAQLAIANCADSERRKDLIEKSVQAVRFSSLLTYIFLTTGPVFRPLHF